MKPYTLNINGKDQIVTAEPETPLLWILRDSLNLKGTKYGCGKALCGACTVHLNGVPTRSCALLVSKIGNAEVVTIEGISKGELHPVQQAWVDQDVPQCGYCQAGQIMSAIALLSTNPNPNDKDIDSAMAGNICRCGTYPRIKKAIKSIFKDI